MHTHVMRDVDGSYLGKHSYVVDTLQNNSPQKDPAFDDSNHQFAASLRIDKTSVVVVNTPRRKTEN